MKKFLLGCVENKINMSVRIEEIVASLEEGPKDFPDMSLNQDQKKAELDYFYREHVPAKCGNPKSEGTLFNHKLVTFQKGPLIFHFLINQDDEPVFFIALKKYSGGVSVGNVRSLGIVRATDIYGHLIDQYGRLYSDYAQTPQGKKIWQNLAQSHSDIDIEDVGNRLVATKRSKT
jgi:hypothetical protein